MFKYLPLVCLLSVAGCSSIPTAKVIVPPPIPPPSLLPISLGSIASSDVPMPEFVGVPINITTNKLVYYNWTSKYCLYGSTNLVDWYMIGSTNQPATSLNTLRIIRTNYSKEFFKMVNVK